MSASIDQRTYLDSLIRVWLLCDYLLIKEKILRTVILNSKHLIIMKTQTLV